MSRDVTLLDGGGPRGPRAALDLGSSRLRASVPAHEVLIDRPSSIAVSPTPAGRRPRGHDAARWTEQGRRYPIRHGIVTDVQGCTQLTRCALLDAAVVAPPGELLLAVPAAATAADRMRAVTAVRAAGGCPVSTVEAVLAAAIGAGRAVTDARPYLVMDIGAGVVEMAVVARWRLVRARSIRYLPTVSAGHPDPRLPQYVQEQLAVELRRMLTDLPPRVRVPARARGLLLTGGCAVLPSLPGRLAAQLAMGVHVAPDPARATIRGLARLCLAPAGVREAVARPAP
ncbi:rod shape-determining protein [Actinomadura viridis]|uniref:rod shape-determining protein n=1 Tax=Actinomadura viridis TaxID=58110 RepID=UPI001E54F681|nr:rod shape-determining protein [Actinomadura viridis]